MNPKELLKFKLDTLESRKAVTGLGSEAIVR